MKKLVLFFLVFFASSVFALATCIDLSILNITQPADDFTLYQTESFTFEAEVWSTDVVVDPPLQQCTAEVTFEYDEGTGGVSFDRIKDPVYTPASGFVYLESEADSTLQYADIINVAYVYIPITVTCNTAGDYDLRLSSPSGGGTTSATITIHCLPIANSPPTGQFLIPAFDTVLYKKDNGTGVPDPFTYTTTWEASDAESDPLEYDIRVLKGGVQVDSASGLANPTYNATINDFNEYTFEVDIKDTESNITTIYSETVLVKDQNFSTLSIADLSLFPEAIYGDGTIDANLTARNNSPDVVDINVIFFNDFFDDAGAGFHAFGQLNVPPFSKVSFSMSEGFSDLSPGDYNVRVVVKEYVGGSINPRNIVESYAFFVVLQPTRPVSMPETNLIAIVLISLAVILITRKKSN